MNLDKITAFPLCWPTSRERTPAAERKPSRFRAGGQHYSTRPITTYVALERVIAELERFKAVDVVVSTNIPSRRDGLPISRAPEPDDPAVAVYFRMSGYAYALACDRWDTVAGNLGAVAAHLEATRGILRWGVITEEEAFAGSRALPPMSRELPASDAAVAHYSPPDDR